MKKVIVYIKTILDIGLFNVLLVIVYRIYTNTFLVLLNFPKKEFKIKNKIFVPGYAKIKIDENDTKQYLKHGDSILNGKIRYYSYHDIEFEGLPNWFANPFNDTTIKQKDEHWSRIRDFNYKLGDIKNLWELSRFNWLGTLACAYKFSKKDKYLNHMNILTEDWTGENHLNSGPNWKCGQEASIRAINIFLANEIISPNKNSDDLINLIKVHIDRINPTTFYAKAQNNNHGISEGVALYVLGYFIWKELRIKKYFSIHKKGLKLIEDRVNKLILDDGTFAQYSIVYHRMVIDILSFAELFRKKWDLYPFSNLFYFKSNLAIEWYSEMIDFETGNAPNIGGNDGTYLFNYDQKDYRDFRPSLSFASSVFNIPIDNIIKSDHCLMTIFSLNSKFIKKESKLSKEYSLGGLKKLVRLRGKAILRIPKYYFRPSHSDALHLDIWQDGINWIRDSGSFSYALTYTEQKNFSGTKGHSTIEFDGEDQMPKISRFLYGNWLNPFKESFDDKKNIMGAGYKDQRGNSHFRDVKEIDNGWEIIDQVEGQCKSVISRWILKPGQWNINGNSISFRNTKIELESDENFNFKLIDGFESMHYMEKTRFLF